MTDLIPIENIENKIFLIRGRKVMIDADLAKLYQVATKRLNEQVRRNRLRFPEDFMFQLTDREKTELVAICDRFKKLKHSSQPPYAFAEQGVAMLSSVLKSARAILVNIQIMRAFTKLREVLSTHKELAEKLGLLEQKVGKHDQEIAAIIQAIQKLIEASHQHPKEEPPKEEPPKRRIGFHRCD